MTRKRPSRTLRKLLRTARAIPPSAQSLLLVVLGAALGSLLTLLIQALSKLHGSPAPTTPSAVHITSTDHCDTPGAPCFVFVFATGRSGTQHLSRVLKSRVSRGRRAYITHEEEHLSMRTRAVVDRDYRRMAGLADEATFNQSMGDYVRRVKLPFYRALLKRAGGNRLVYTGHVPMVFGMGPSLVESLPEGSLRVLRMRRERVATAVSLMALGPEEEDPWGVGDGERVGGGVGGAKEGGTVNRRWFLKPGDAMVRLEVADEVWNAFNRFQRWLWYVDDVECRWQALKRGYEGRFSWMEDNLEAMSVMDGGAGWKRVAEFAGVAVNWAQIGERDNSIEYKMRAKINVSETVLRRWDVEYRRLVGRCRLDSKEAYGWSVHPLSRQPFS